MTVQKIDTSVFDQKIAKVLEKIGVLVENEAIVRCPVDTGNMRSKITHKVEGDSVRIGTVGVPYAKFIEYGTDRIEVGTPEAPRTSWPALEERGGSGQTMPFLRPAVFFAEPNIVKLFKEEFH